MAYNATVANEKESPIRMRLGARIGVVLPVVLLASISGNAQPQVKPSEAIVTGNVTDVSKAVVPNALVRIAGNEGTFSMQTLSNGDYVIKAPPGTYEISVSLPGFCKGRRAPFSLKAGAEVKFDFELLVCPIVDYVYVPSHDGLPATPPKLRDRYQDEQLPTIGPGGLRPLVLFGGREEKGDLTIYSNLTLQDWHFPVVYTYDLLTIKADSLTHSRSDDSITGTGNVVFQDGKGTRRGSSIRVVFDKGAPQVDLSD
jgi:hypothetical protein